MIQFLIFAAEAVAPQPPPEGGLKGLLMYLLAAVGGGLVTYLWGGKKPDPNKPPAEPVPTPPLPPGVDPKERPVLDMVAVLITVALDASRGLNPVRDQAINFALGQLRWVLDYAGVAPIPMPLPVSPPQQQAQAMSPAGGT